MGSRHPRGTIIVVIHMGERQDSNTMNVKTQLCRILRCSALSQRPRIHLLENSRLFVFVGFTVVAWTIVISVARWPMPVYDDMLEAWSWGQQWQLGYYKHPPFYAWVTAAWFQVWPRTDWAFYLLSNVNVGIGLIGVWMIARRLLATHFGTAASVALLTLTPFYNVMASNFNANTVLLSLWPWTTYAFIRTLQSRGNYFAFLFGALAACSMLSKYSSSLLLASCFISACLHPDRQRIFKSSAPYIGTATCIVLLLPHLWWSMANDFPTIKYALTKTARPWPDGLLNVAETSFAIAIALAFPLMALNLALRMQSGRVNGRMGFRKITRQDIQPAWLTTLAVGPLLLTLLPAFLGLTKASLNFTIPTFFMLPMLVLSLIEKRFHSSNIKVFWRIGWLTPVSALLVAPAVGVITMVSDLGQSTKYNAIAAKRGAVIWRATFGQPVKIVSGTEPFSLAQPFYTNEAPQEFSHFSLEEAPWVTREHIERNGLLSICEVNDFGCQRNAAKFASGGTQVFAETFQLKFLGVSLRPVSLMFIMTPPQRYLPRLSPSLEAEQVSHR
jgi:4-amino-4-deoxy-L-arabinose transferase-like glycosyltransferase